MKRIQSLTCTALLLTLATPVFAQESPLICFGTEPFWRLDLIEPGKATFSTPDSSSTSYQGSGQTLAHRGETIWRGAAADSEGADLVAFLREAACSDQMSDTVHPFVINVSLPDGRHLAGCCRLQAAQVEQANFEHADWHLTELPGRALPSGTGLAAVTLRFENGRVYGFAGCNQFSGAYTLEGTIVTIGELAATAMACPEPAMSLERDFLASFSGALAVAILGDEMTLTRPNGSTALRFERQALPRLAGVEWEVTGFNNGRQAIVGVLNETRITLKFEDGQVSGSSGCNRFGGSYSTDEGTLSIGMLRTTRMACPGEVMEQEQQFLAALKSASSWVIVRGMLDVHRADGERALTANPVGE